MRVFLGWSGERSKSVAEALHEWLPNVLQYVKPWMSAVDIDKGSRWLQELGRELESTDFGIICITADNMAAPWLNFEAGALSKSVDESRVVPYLLGIEEKDLREPLSQFQAGPADKEHTFKLVNSVNNVADGSKLDSERVKNSFEVWWPRLKDQLDKANLSKPTAKKERSESELVAEILGLVRAQGQSLAAIEKAIVGPRADVAQRAVMESIRRMGAHPISTAPDAESQKRIQEALVAWLSERRKFGEKPVDDEEAGGAMPAGV